MKKRARKITTVILVLTMIFGVILSSPVSFSASVYGKYSGGDTVGSSYAAVGINGKDSNLSTDEWLTLHLYNNFLMSKSHERFIPDMFKSGTPGFFLYDLDFDGMPELLMNTGYAAASYNHEVFTVENHSVIRMMSKPLMGSFAGYAPGTAYKGFFSIYQRQGAAFYNYHYVKSGQWITESVATYQINNSNNSYEMTFSTENTDLYNTFIDVTGSAKGSQKGLREFLYPGSQYSFDSIKSMGWESFTAKYGYIYPSGVNNELDFSKDVWSFKNYSDSKCYPKNDNMLDYYTDSHIINLSPSNRELIKSYLYDGSDGHCFGMSAMVILQKLGMEKFSYTANNLREVENGDYIKSKICYYQAIQSLPDYKASVYRFNQYTVKDQLLQIAYMADNVKRGWNPILICYEKKNGSAHALVGYALEKGSFESSSSGKIYDHRILTYDCNRINWDEERCIYFNLGTDEWEIPHYDEVSSYDEAWFQCATNDTRIFDAVDEYVDVQFPMISIDTDSYVVIRKTNGNEQWLVDPKTGEVTGSSKLLVYHDIETDGEENKSSKLNVFLPDSSSDYVFETKSGSAAELDLKVQYNGKYLSVNTKSAKGATISFDGSASVKGNEGEFTITAASDDLHEENKFDSFTIKGSNKGNTSLSLAKSGIIVEGNNTKGVLVNASNAAQTGTTRIEETIYKELSNNKADYTAPGDVNDDGNINGADAGVLNRYASGWQGYADKIKNMDVADMNGDGKVNGADAGILSRYVSGWDGYDKYFSLRY